MKTKEFADRLRAMGYIVVLDDGIFDIYDNGNAVALVYEKELFRLSLVRGKAVNKSLFDSCVEYAQTPLAEREEEKRYYLRYDVPPLLRAVQAKPRYLYKRIYDGYIDTSFSQTNDSTFKTIFTESEIAKMDITGFCKEEVN